MDENNERHDTHNNLLIRIFEEIDLFLTNTEHSEVFLEKIINKL